MRLMFTNSCHDVATLITNNPPTAVHLRTSDVIVMGGDAEISKVKLVVAIVGYNWQVPMSNPQMSLELWSIHSPKLDT